MSHVVTFDNASARAYIFYIGWCCFFVALAFYSGYLLYLLQKSHPGGITYGDLAGEIVGTVGKNVSFRFCHLVLSCVAPDPLPPSPAAGVRVHLHRVFRKHGDLGLDLLRRIG